MTGADCVTHLHVRLARLALEDNLDGIRELGVGEDLEGTATRSAFSQADKQTHYSYEQTV